MKKKFTLKKVVVILLFTLAFALLSHHIFQHDLFFDSDIGRDFLLIEDVLANKNLTLIGPRADGIPGMFFGPHWIYLNIPFFIIGGGNPEVIAFSWLFLILISITSVYYVAKRIFNNEIGIISALLYSYLLVPFSAGFTQSFLAPLLAPWIVLLLVLYAQKSRFMHLSLALFLCGVLYQFQPAFGMITIPFSVLIILFLVFKNHKYIHLISFIFLILPFSVLFLSEIRSNFLQTNSFIDHIADKDKSKILFIDLLKIRLSLLVNILNITKINLLAPLYLSIFIFILYKLRYTKKSIYKSYYIIYFILILGFFIISFLFKGRFNDYHTWGFLSLTTISIAGLMKFVKNKKLYYVVITATILIAISQAIYFRYWWTNNFRDDYLSWKANNKVAEYIFNNEKNDFGFYVYSYDEFGYSMRYAMIFNDRKSDINSALCKKSQYTYLIYGPSPSGELSKPTFWKEERVKIYKNPINSVIIGDYIIEKYHLNEEEIKIEADPNLICDLHFR